MQYQTSFSSLRTQSVAYPALLALVVLSFGLVHAGATAQEAKVDINTADVTLLAKKLKGVGPRLARRIVAFREEHGPFPTVEALIEVKGVGNSVLEKNHKILIASEVQNN